MGNFLRRSCAVHPDSGNGRRRYMEEPPQEEERRRSLRIKVRMRRDQLEEFLYLARHDDDQSNDNKSNKVGLLILKECMEGRLPASVLGSGDDVRSQRCGSYVVRSPGLDSIAEE